MVWSGPLCKSAADHTLTDGYTFTERFSTLSQRFSGPHFVLVDVKGLALSILFNPDCLYCSTCLRAKTFHRGDFGLSLSEREFMWMRLEKASEWVLCIVCCGLWHFACLAGCWSPRESDWGAFGCPSAGGAVQSPCEGGGCPAHPDHSRHTRFRRCSGQQQLVSWSLHWSFKGSACQEYKLVIILVKK